MSFLKFLWLAIRPISKLESAIGWWDVFNIAAWVIYGIPAIPAIDIASGINWAWFAGVPALLFLIAGVKLQLKLDSYKSKIPKLEYRLLPFPQSGMRILTKGEDERQLGYAKIAITNKGSRVDDCIGTVCDIYAISNLKGKLVINKLIFTPERLRWYDNDERITIPNDKLERFLNLAYIDQRNPGAWRLAIKAGQKRDYGLGWWKIDVVVSSLSTQMEPLRIEIVLGLGDREYPASGINLWPWGKWYETKQRELKQASNTEGSQP